MEDNEECEKTIAKDLVVTKYKMAGNIVNCVLKKVLSQCVEGASVRQVCIFGDELILEETNKVFKREKNLKKGIAFPTCISVNNCICHFSPLNSEPDYVLQHEDVVKVNLGAHVDGFIAVVGHTMVLGASENNKVRGKKADVMMAAHFAAEAALRLLKAGNQTDTITETVKKVAEAYNCRPVEDMLSHQLKQFSIEDEKTIIQNPSEDLKREHEEHEFETYEVYAIDLLVSTGEGVARDMGTRVSIFRKTDEIYQLKLKASRMFYSEVNNKYSTMPFNLRNFSDEKKAKLGVNECINHKVIKPYQVLYERPSEVVAQFQFTVLLMPNGPHRITGLPFETNIYESELAITDPELKSILILSANPKTIKKRNKKICKAGEEAVMELVGSA